MTYAAAQEISMNLLVMPATPLQSALALNSSETAAGRKRSPRLVLPGPMGVGGKGQWELHGRGGGEGTGMVGKPNSATSISLVVLFPAKWLVPLADGRSHVII